MSSKAHPDHYTISKILGQGRHSILYHATDQRDKHDVALKIFFCQKKTDQQTDSASRFLKHAETLQNLEHPNLIKIYDFGLHKHKCYLAMPLQSGSNLVIFLQNRAKISLQEKILIISQLIDCIEYLHSQEIVHGNITEENILLQENQHLLLTGIDIFFHSNKQTLYPDTVQSPPKSLQQEDHTPPSFKADIIACARLCYRLLSGVQKIPENPEEYRTLTSINSEIPSGIDTLLKPYCYSEANDNLLSMQDFSEALRQAFLPNDRNDSEQVEQNPPLHEAKQKTPAEHTLTLEPQLKFSEALPSELKNSDQHFTLAQDGSGDFTSLHKALQTIPAWSTLFICPGSWKESQKLEINKPVILCSKDNSQQVFIEIASRRGLSLNSSEILFENLILKHSKTFLSRKFIHIHKGTVRFNNCNIQSKAKVAVWMHKKTQSHFDHCQIQGKVHALQCQAHSQSKIESSTLMALQGNAISNKASASVDLVGSRTKDALYQKKPEQNHNVASSANKIKPLATHISFGDLIKHILSGSLLTALFSLFLMAGLHTFNIELSFIQFSALLGAICGIWYGNFFWPLWTAPCGALIGWTAFTHMWAINSLYWLKSLIHPFAPKLLPLLHVNYLIHLYNAIILGFLLWMVGSLIKVLRAETHL